MPGRGVSVGCEGDEVPRMQQRQWDASMAGTLPAPWLGQAVRRGFGENQFHSL